MLCLSYHVVVKRRKKKTSKYGNKSPNIAASKEILLTENDRILYAYKRNSAGQYSEVVNVSYEIHLKEKWITIVRYDSSHGYLHKHIRTSFLDERETTSTGGVIKKGSHHKWLTWALNDLKLNFIEYRRLFFKRSKTVDNY